MTIHASVFGPMTLSEAHEALRTMRQSAATVRRRGWTQQCEPRAVDFARRASPRAATEVPQERAIA